MKPRTPSVARLSFALASAIIALLAAQSANAANYYWDNNSTTTGLSTGAGTSGTWNGATNASNTYVSLPFGNLDGTAALVAGGTATASADSIYFGTNNLGLGATASVITTTGAISINNIVFGTGQGAQGVTLGSGGTITLGGTTPTLTSNNTGTNTIAAVLAGTAMTTAGSGTLTLTNASNSLSGTVTVTGGGRLNLGDGTTGGFTATTNALTFNAGGGTFNLAEADTGSQTMAALSFSAGDGAVISTAASGSASQTLTFGSFTARTAGATGNFSLAGNTTAASNKIVLTSSTNAPVNGSGSNNRGLFFGGTEYTRYDTSAGYFRAVTYGTDFNASSIVDTGATLGVNDATKDVKISGDITGQTTASVNTLNLAASNLTFQSTASTLSVNGILSAGSASGSIANGTNASSIQTIASGGGVVVRVNGSGDTLTIAPNIVANGASSLIKSGAGTLTLSGTNTYTGATTINGGTLALSGGAAIANTGAVVLANAAGTTFQLNNSETVGNLSGGGFSGGNVNVGANTLTIGNANSLTFGGKLIGSGGVTISSGTLTLSNKNTFAGTITLNGTSQLNLTYGIDGTATPPTISSGGTISMSNGTSLAMRPTAEVAAGVALGEVGGSVAVGTVVSNPIVVSSGTATIKQIAQGAPRYVFSGGATGGTSGSQTLDIHQGAGGGNCERTTITVSGVIQNGSGGTLGVSADFKSVSLPTQGAFICLTGLNTFTGPIVVRNTVGLIDDGIAYRGAWFVIGGEITSSFGDRTTTPGTGALGWDGSVGNYSGTISLATGTILNYMSSANQTLGGVISGTGRILKEGSGTLSLTVGNTYTGATNVTSGVLKITNATSLGTVAGGATVASGSALEIDGSGGTVIVGAEALGINGSGISSGGALRNIAGNNTYGGTVTLAAQSSINSDSGTLLLNNATAVTATNQNLVVGGAGDITVSGAITTGTGSVSKGGAGTLALTAANTYTGATTVNSGTLRVNNTTGSGTGSGNVSVTAGTLGGSGSISGAVTIGNSTGTADSILAPGNSIGTIATGNLVFSSDGSYAAELDGTSGTSDQTNVTGTVTINAATTLTVSLTGSLAPGQKYFVVNNDGVDAVTGTFAGRAQDAIIGNFGGTELKISYTGDSGTSAITGGNDIVLYTSGSPYDTWANGTYSPALTAKLSGDNQDGDSLTNLQEFAFGTQPTVSTGEIAYSGVTLTTPGAPKFVAASGTYYMVFGRRADYVAAGLTYTVQFSAGLDTWVDNVDGTNAPVQVATDGTINVMSVPYVNTIETPSGPRKPTFSRVKVVLAP